MFVLGIDPGLTRCGYGAVRRAPNGTLTAVAAGVLRTSVGDDVALRLGALSLDIDELMDDLRPDAVVVERVFFQTNAHTAISVAQASGLALAAAARRSCAIGQYTSNEVKLAVAGYGAATKLQMQRMVQTLLNLSAHPDPPDAADALALALAHCALAPRLALAAKHS